MHIKHVSTLALIAVAACGAPGAPAIVTKEARNAAYDADFDVVWAATLDALRVDYPTAKVLDKDKHKIVTCWRPIDRADPASGWRLFRTIVEISPKRPYRIGVAGRSAELSLPSIRPHKEGDVGEPDWRERETERLQMAIHDRLKQYAKVTNQETPPLANPDKEETYESACITRPESLAIEAGAKKGIPIGE